MQVGGKQSDIMCLLHWTLDNDLLSPMEDLHNLSLTDSLGERLAKCHFLALGDFIT